MTITMRIARLFKADVHGLLDLLEEHETVLKQAIRDMETEIERGEQTLVECEQKEEALRGAATHLENAVATLEEQIDIAFEAQNEALARTFVRKKLETENRLHSTFRAIEALTAETDAMRRQIHDQKTQLDAILNQVPHDVGEPSPSSPPVGSAVSFGVAEEDVEAAFLKEQRKRTDSTGRD